MASTRDSGIKELRNIAIKTGYDCPDGVLFQPSNNTWGDYWSSSSIETSNNSMFSMFGTLDAWFMRFSDMTYMVIVREIIGFMSVLFVVYK